MEKVPFMSSDIPTRVGRYVITERIGTGSFSCVYKAQHIQTLSIVALKAFDKSLFESQASINLIQREIDLLQGIEHPFIASFFESLEDEHKIYIAQEYVENGSLLDHINQRHGLTEIDSRRLFCQLLSALDYLHNRKHVVHRDLKAENLLLDAHYNARIIDFGFSKAFTPGSPNLSTACGSPAYVAPEVLLEEPYNAAADIWSAGVLLCLMTTGRYPFNPENMSNLMQEILSGDPALPANLSLPLASLILRMLDKNPETRITLPEIRQSPWIASTDDADLLSKDHVLMASLRTMDIVALDESIASELRALRFDITGLVSELTSGAVTPRTAAYRMLLRARVANEIRDWQRVPGLPKLPASLSAKATPVALFLKQPSGLVLGVNSAQRRRSEVFGNAPAAQVPKFRKRAPPPRLVAGSLTPPPQEMRGDRLLIPRPPTPMGKPPLSPL
jgi:serine/threonine protein kinase